MELTLLGLDEQLVLQESLQHPTHVLHMILFGLREN
jgi:hypothetical protein